VTGVVAVSQGLGPELISTSEWHSVSTRQHNAIFEGPEHATEGLLLLLQPYLRTPAIWRRAPMPLELPTHGCGALVLRNVCALGRREQTSLLRWLDAERKQVVSTTAHPLFPLIARGLFDEALYYRLNVMLMRIDSTGAADVLGNRLATRQNGDMLEHRLSAIAKP
jgi:Sigma-54 interaction domain